MSVVKNIVNLVSFNPKDIPVVTLSFFVSALSEGLEDTVPKRGFEFDLTEVVHVVIFLDVFSEILRHFVELF